MYAGTGWVLLAGSGSACSQGDEPSQEQQAPGADDRHRHPVPDPAEPADEFCLGNGHGQPQQLIPQSVRGTVHLFLYLKETSCYMMI